MTTRSTIESFVGNTAIVHYRDAMPSQYSPGFAATLASFPELDTLPGLAACADIDGDACEREIVYGETGRPFLVREAYFTVHAS